MKLASGWSRFWFERVDSIRLDCFRVIFGAALFLYYGRRWPHAAEWLTNYGFHFSKYSNLEYSPLWLPVLPGWALQWFGVAMFSFILLFIFGKKVRFSAFIICLFVFYINHADRITASALSKVFMFVFFLLSLGYRKERGIDGRTLVPVWSIRIMQIMLVVLYFGAGVSKAFQGGAWLESPYILWAQLQGVFCTDFAAWMYQTMPKWMWPIMQYSALSFEIFAPVLFIVKRFRPIGFAMGLGLHLFIALSMQTVAYFALQMVSFYILFMEPKTLFHLQGYLRNLWTKIEVWRRQLSNFLGP